MSQDITELQTLYESFEADKDTLDMPLWDLVEKAQSSKLEDLDSLLDLFISAKLMTLTAIETVHRKLKSMGEGLEPSDVDSFFQTYGNLYQLKFLEGVLNLKIQYLDRERAFKKANLEN